MSFGSRPSPAHGGGHPDRDPAGPSAYRILLRTRREGEGERIRALLDQEYIPCEVTRVDGEPAFQGALSAAFCYDLILLEYEGDCGPRALAAALHGGPSIPVVVLCDAAGEEAALASLRSGAFDCVRLDLPLRLAPVVRRALEAARAVALRAEADASRARLAALARALLESTAEGILVADLAGRVMAYNRKFMGLCGLPEFVLAPMDLSRAIQSLMDQFEDPSSFLEEVRRLVQHPGGQVHGILRAGEDHVLEGSALAFPEGERPEGLVLRFRDVTGREKAAALLAQQAEVQKDFLKDAEEAGIVLWHARGGALSLSRAAAPLLGLAQDALPTTMEQFALHIHPEDLDTFRKAMGGRTPLLELRLMGPGGAWIPCLWAVVRDAEGGCRGAVRPLTEDRRRRNHRADLRRRWTASLAASLVRAFREPVQVLSGSLDAVREGSREGARLAAMGEALKNIRGLLDAIACLAGPGSAEGLLLDLNAEAGSLQGWCAGVLGPAVHLRWDLQPGLPPLPLPPGSLEPLLSSLLLNASQAMEGHGTIRVTTGREGSGDGERLFLEVRDEGPGIPPRIQARMFDPFFTTRKGARGLGLTVAACVAESLGGSIEVETAPLKGAAFRLWLPAFPAPRRS